MKPVTLNRLTIGSGQPKICIPIVARTKQEVLETAAQIARSPADLVEWRLDFFKSLSPQTIVETAAELRPMLQGRPLLATFRSRREGGQPQTDDSAGIRIYHSLMDGQLAEAVDLELSQPETIRRSILSAAEQTGTKVVMSYHNFQQTPPQKTIETLLEKMAAEQADIAKIAVMPQIPADVLTLMSATVSARSRLDIPVVTMAMGPLGKISRISGSLTGSAMTFGSLDHASAPGQINAGLLKKILDELAADP